MVEWKKLGEVCYISDYVSNGSFASLRENVQYRNEPDFAILVRFADYTSGFDESKFVYIDEHAYNFLSKSSLEGGEIVMSNVGSCGLFFRCPKLGKKMSLAPNSILIKSDFIDYLFHWFSSNRGQEDIKKITSKSAMPKFNKTEFKKIQIPIPSLAEQERIVGILDTFTASIENLKEQIAQRRKQYEYYRDQLLDLEGKEGVEMKTLGEICEISAGGDVPKGNISPIKTDIFCVPIVSNGVGEKSIYGYTDLIKIKKTSVTVAARGTIGYAEYRNYPYYPIVRLISVVPSVMNLNARFLYYLLSKQKYKIPKSGIPQLTVPMINKVRTPLPSLSEQERIVSILDTFEASIQNLEAQLKEREKQYEYYRNKLLTFE